MRSKTHRRQKRDRHGRGSRDIRTAQSFDAGVFDAVDRLKAEWPSVLGRLEFAVTDIPREQDLVAGQILLSDVESVGDQQRIVIYRQPIELRAETTSERDRLIFQAVVEQVAQILGIAPEEVDEEYGYDDW